MVKPPSRERHSSPSLSPEGGTIGSGWHSTLWRSGSAARSPVGGWGPGTSLGAKVPDSAALITTQASFLPGVGGKWGVPMWAFYVTRGQGMATFGVETKDGGISLFQTAEKTYQVTPFVGFRTLLKGTRASGTSFESQHVLKSFAPVLEVVGGGGEGVEEHVHEPVVPPMVPPLMQ